MTRLGVNQLEYETSDGWVCIDCLFVLANDDWPEEPETVAAIESGLAEVAEMPHGYVSLGRLVDEDCEHDVEDYETHAEQCERQDFSWSSCDLCGSHLGGAREAVTFWWTQ